MARRILLVDDDDDFLMILGDRLRSAGYDVADRTKWVGWYRGDP